MALSDKDRERIIKTLAEGKDLPTSYQAKLFESDEVDYVEATKDYKLIYKGKTPEARVIAETPAAPLQEIGEFNTDNAFNDDWANMLIFGDNLHALKAIYEDQQNGNKLKTKNKIKLIYIDPPFATKQDFMKDREKAYRDKVIGAEFIEFLRKRLILLREILADDGSIYVHLDWKKGHYMKTIMDEVFGEHNFQREIIWDISVLSGYKTMAENWIRGHETIFYYSKKNAPIFNKLSVEHRAEYIRRFDKVDENGERYFDGRGGKRYLKDVLARGKAIGDVWDDIMSFQQNPTSKEKIDYPTQKPELLLDRIIRSATNDDNDIVVDAFIGSGTTLAVAEKLGRRWIGMDCGKLAIYTAQKRLLNLEEQIGSAKNDDSRDFKRVEDMEGHSKASRGLFMIFEKARTGDLVVTDSFLTSLGNVNQELEKAGEDWRYHFYFLSPTDYAGFFDVLRDGSYDGWKSELMQGLT